MVKICYKEKGGVIVIFEQRLNEVIEDGDISINELAQKLGITRQQIARWRKGTSEAGVYKLREICLIYGISADYLLGLPKGMEWPR